MSLPPQALLLDIYRHMPFMVIHVTTDGVVLHCNPEACRLTGYEEAELLGKNFWATLFPGKLFAQVPRFISLLEPSPLLKDMPMAIRTKSGGERVIGFSRYVHTDVTHENDAAPRSFICIGVDLTDRLLQADRNQLPEATSGPGSATFGPHIGNAGTIDSEVVTPIAISPKPTGVAGPCPIEQVREGLARVETHINCVKGAFGEGEAQTIAALSQVTRKEPTGEPPIIRQGTMGFELLALRDEMHLRACRQSLGAIQARVDEMLALHRPEMG